MPSPTTAINLISSALALTNAVGVDQTLTAHETSDCLDGLNDLIEEWSTDSLSLWASANQTFNLVPGQAVYTIGTGGNFNTDRPVHISQQMYTVINGATFPAVFMTQQEYNLIAVKDQAGQYPVRYLYVNDFPLGLITFWPVPNTVYPITISMDRLLTQAATAATVLSYPPGYTKALRYNLAVDLAPIFGKTASDTVKAIAKSSYASIKRANQKPRIVQADVALLPNWGWTRNGQYY